MKRYHPVHVALHWLIALMILVALLLGGPSLVAIDNANPEKIMPLTGHAIWGMVIGVLMLVRFGIKMMTQNPEPADAGHSMLNLGARVAHSVLYVLVFAMVGSGIGIALSANLFPILFGGSEAALPATFDGIFARTVHGLVATAILLVVGLHVVGWAYHQFVRKDHLFSRMWFGRR